MSTFLSFVLLDDMTRAMAGVGMSLDIVCARRQESTAVDTEGRPLPRPVIRELHSDREGKLMSHSFRDFRAGGSGSIFHHTTSPPHDHDLNPIAERIIGLISENAAAIRIDSNADPRLWPTNFRARP